MSASLFDEHMHDVQNALAQARIAIERGETGVADFLILTAQHQLGLVHERFAGASLEQHRKALRIASRNLSSIRAIIADDSNLVLLKIQHSQYEQDALRAQLSSHVHQTLYDIKVFQEALALAKR